MPQVTKIIITGAAGEVGFNLVQTILTKKNTYHIIALDKNQHNLSLLQTLFPQIETHLVDLAEQGNWEQLFTGAYAVIQLQAQISSPYPEAYIRNNIDSVRNVVNVCEKYHIKRLIHVSSSVVISVADDDYTRTKRVGEKIVDTCKVPHTILRPTLMYGCFDVKHLGYLTRFFSLSPIFPMPGSGKYIRQPLFVEDFCHILLNAMESKQDNKIYNITGKEQIYLLDLLKIIAKAMHKPILFLKIPLSVFHLLIRLYNLVNRKSRIIPEQLTALTAGDIFPVIDWEKKFHVHATPFVDGVKKMLTSSHYTYTYQLTRSNL